MPMLVEYAFDYSSNFFDDDSPYLHDVDGQQTKIVELPFRWVLDDAPFFQYSIVLPGRTMHPPSSVLESWMTEFDVLYSEDRMMMVGMHPEIIHQTLERAWAARDRWQQMGQAAFTRADQAVPKDWAAQMFELVRTAVAR